MSLGSCGMPPPPFGECIRQAEIWVQSKFPYEQRHAAMSVWGHSRPRADSKPGHARYARKAEVNSAHQTRGVEPGISRFPDVPHEQSSKDGGTSPKEISSTSTPIRVLLGVYLE